jgi:hypothetical protein
LYRGYKQKSIIVSVNTSLDSSKKRIKSPLAILTRSCGCATFILKKKINNKSLRGLCAKQSSSLTQDCFDAKDPAQ